jgi:hypothetical protein
MGKPSKPEAVIAEFEFAGTLSLKLSSNISCVIWFLVAENGGLLLQSYDSGRAFARRTAQPGVPEA